MSRTRRAYNFPSWYGRGWNEYHPYGSGCMGKCSFCREHGLTKRKRAARKDELRAAVEEL
jgi:hypothetical protein